MGVQSSADDRLMMSAQYWQPHRFVGHRLVELVLEWTGWCVCQPLLEEVLLWLIIDCSGLNPWNQSLRTDGSDVEEHRSLFLSHPSWAGVSTIVPLNQTWGLISPMVLWWRMGNQAGPLNTALILDTDLNGLSPEDSQMLWPGSYWGAGMRWRSAYCRVRSCVWRRTPTLTCSCLSGVGWREQPALPPAQGTMGVETLKTPQKEIVWSQRKSNCRSNGAPRRRVIGCDTAKILN